MHGGGEECRSRVPRGRCLRLRRYCRVTMRHAIFCFPRGPQRFRCSPILRLVHPPFVCVVLRMRGCVRSSTWCCAVERGKRKENSDVSVNKVVVSLKLSDDSLSCSKCPGTAEKRIEKLAIFVSVLVQTYGISLLQNVFETFSYEVSVLCQDSLVFVPAVFKTKHKFELL